MVYFTSFEDRGGKGLTLKRELSVRGLNKNGKKKKESEEQLFGYVLYRSSKSLTDYDWGGKNIVL